MDLCALGANVKYVEGYRAVFTEQGASASQMAFQNFLVWLEKN